MELFSPSGSHNVSSQIVFAETMQAMVRALSAEMQQRLSSGELLSARVVKNSTEVIQIKLGGASIV